MRTRSAWLAILALVLLPCIPASAHAQLGTSTWSLEVGTSVGSSYSYEFAVRRHTGPGTAFRLGIDAYLEKQDGDGERRDTGQPDRPATTFYDYHDVTLSLDWMRFASVRDNVSMIFATGPVLRSYRDDSRSGSGAGSAAFYENEYRNDETAFGWEFLLGAEWRFTPRFTLGGVAGLRGEVGTAHRVSMTRTGTGATYSIDETQIKSDASVLRSVPGRIYLTAYF